MGNRKNERLRYRYGICLNENCEKCKSKEVQEVSVRKDFVCSNPECGKPLRECPPPKKGEKMKWILIAIIALAVIGAIIGGIITFTGDENKSSEPVATDTTKKAPVVPVKPDTVVMRDTLVVRDTIIQNNTTTITEKTSTRTTVNTTTPAQPKPVTPAASGSGTIHLSYGTYSGATKNGYPHGQGRLTYSTTRQINRNDVKGRTANAGDYVIGEFFNGFVVYGKHYDSAGNLLESLNFGIGSENSYESK